MMISVIVWMSQRKARKKEKLRAQKKAEKEAMKRDKKKKEAADWITHEDRRQYYGDHISADGVIMRTSE